MDSAPRCQDDAVIAPPGDHAVVSRLQSMAYEKMIPLNVSLELTLACNIRCLHCYNFDRDEARGQAVAFGDCSEGNLVVHFRCSGIDRGPLFENRVDAGDVVEVRVYGGNVEIDEIAMAEDFRLTGVGQNDEFMA